MKKIFSSQDLTSLSYYKAVLENQGIACYTKNYFLTGAAGELPLDACWPELWVLDSSQAQKAETLLAELNQPVAGKHWQCLHCHETNEPQFGICWHCNTSSG